MIDNIITEQNVLSKTDKRFWSKIKFDTPDKCWEWQSALTKDGYAHYHAKRLNNKNVDVRSHRYLFILIFGELQKDTCVLHQCDNRKCVNPNHLFSGTNKDNVDDRMKKGRHGFGRTFGKSHPMSKLTDEMMVEIRTRLSRGDVQRKIASDFSVSPALICLIKSGKIRNINTNVL